ncbi:capsule biosynthesis protein [Allorhizobium sp. BGMRC 0089]|uniref:capsule biosynthesis protein n=1 Tax=Allorhizobium sonneratiae TaxID=2934936 RepID=UPI00203417A4|nr:capsule biosynthesis protein [Allorhizobium sonneratiae]MCM2292023.1 capsule biosynthesis protein [Allorhizobium sonneratiae]
MAEPFKHQTDGEPLTRSQDIAARLSVAARKLRFSTSNRSKLFKAAGLRPRPLEVLLNRLNMASVAILLVLPILFGLVYYGLIASDKYESETRFTLGTSSIALGRDQIGKATGIPSAMIAQDTMIVAEFITSREMVDALQKRVDLHKIYGNSSIDPLSRLEDDATAEEMTKYWDKMASASINATSGIITVKVVAFSAKDAQNLLKQVVAISEDKINEINDRIWRDVTNTAETNVQRATERLKTARADLQQAQNASGVLSVGASSTVLSTLIATAQGELLSLQQKYQSQSRFVSANAPQMKVLKQAINSKQKQIDELNRQMAGTGDSDSKQRSLADVSFDLSQKELEDKLAAQDFAASVQTLEQVKFTSKQQLMYLDTFVQPDLPDKPRYPHRFLMIVGIAAASLCLWGLSLLGIGHLRKKII